MYIIKYFNNEPIPEIEIIKEEINDIIIEREEIIFKENIVSLQYKVYSEEDKNRWLDIIQKSYGKWGEVTVEYTGEPKPFTIEEQLELLKSTLSTSANDTAKLMFAIMDKQKGSEIV